MRNKTTRMHEKEIVKEYKSGVSAYALSKKYGGSIVLIQTIVKENGIEIRGCKEAVHNKRVYSLDKNCFNQITDDSAYWIGMLLADGYMSKKGQIDLALKYTDIEHIKKFKEFVKSDSEIRIKKNNRGYNTDVKNNTDLSVLSIHSTELANQLSTYNVSNNKSSTSSCPDILLNNRHFWRGCIDGDGCITSARSKRGVVCLYGTQKLCQQFLNFVKSNIPEEVIKNNVYKHSSIYVVSFSKRTLVPKLLNLLYANCNTYLNRKKDLATNLINNLNK